MKLKEIISWVICILIAIISAFFIKNYIFELTKVEGNSMLPNFSDGQRLIVGKIGIKSNIKRNDIVIFEAPSDLKDGNLIAQYDEIKMNIIKKCIFNTLEINKKSYIKRVIATEGESVQINEGKVFINGKEINESFLKKGTYTNVSKQEFETFVVPKGTVFVMGDNRNGSSDSRIFGCIPISKIRGKVIFRIFPINKIGKI